MSEIYDYENSNEPETSQHVSQPSSSRSCSKASSVISKCVGSTSWSKYSTSKEKRLSRTIKGPSHETILSPFHLRWSFGMSVDVRMLNLTTKDRTLVLYAATHAAIMYDYVAREMRLLQGHKNFVQDISADGSGKWLVSADRGPDSSIIVWNSIECIPVHTLFDPHPLYGIEVIEMSKNAKFIVSVGAEPKPELKFWLWTFGKDQPDDSHMFETSYGSVVRVRFNPNNQEHMMVAFERYVAFVTWDDAAHKLIVHNTSPCKIRKGVITDCTYIEDCHECVACSSNGCIVVYGTNYYFTSFEEETLQNDKKYIKTMKVSSAYINCIESVDGLIVTGDVKGQIKFFDRRVRILYWCQNFTVPSVTSISFHLDPRRYKIQDPWDFENDKMFDGFTEEYEDKSEEYEYLYAELVPSDATLARLPFVVRDFIIATVDGRIATIDYMHNKCHFLFRASDAPVTTIDIHDELNYLVIGYNNAKICLYNYTSRDVVTHYTFPEDPDSFSIVPVAVTALKYSPRSLHLACGRANGTLWFLDPIHLNPKHQEAYKVSKGSIVKIDFSLDSLYCGCYDNNSTICLLKYDNENNVWILLGKMRPHYKLVSDILFTPYLPSRFFSIGFDRHLIEYDLESSENGNLEILNDERIEQTAVPVSFTYCPQKEGIKEQYFFITDNQYKYKRVNDNTFMCHSVLLGPVYGCYQNSPVLKTTFLPRHKDTYLIYANVKHIGIQLLPIDGNPYKYVGTIGHPRALADFKCCREGKFVFTFGENDNCVLMWQINVVAPHYMNRIGGFELEPFYCMIEGGIHGWLFKEMQDLFYYMQILHEGENTVLPRVVTDRIPITELPDLMRACGFYPTDFEIENMIIDVKYRDYDETKTLNLDITFLDFVKLYINYRPVGGISIDRLENNFNVICRGGREDNRNADNIISAESFVVTICEKGEFFNSDTVQICLATLMHQKFREPHEPLDFMFLPDEIDFNFFLEEMLGMDSVRQPLEDTNTQTQNEAEDAC